MVRERYPVTISGNLTRDPELRRPEAARLAHNVGGDNERRTVRGWQRHVVLEVTIWSGLGEWISDNVGHGPAAPAPL